MMKNRSIRVTTIVHTHCLGVYQRPVAPLRETLCDLSQCNAFDDFIMRSRTAVPKNSFSLSFSLFSAAGKREGVKRTYTCCTRVTRLSRRNTRTRTHTNRHTHTHTHTHTPQRSHAEEQKTEKKTSRDDISAFFASNGVEWQ